MQDFYKGKIFILTKRFNHNQFKEWHDTGNTAEASIEKSQKNERDYVGLVFFFFFKINVEREYVGLVGHVATKTVITWVADQYPEHDYLYIFL